ncbi:OmpA/MotB family protein [Marinisporobacter balticus]|uniref:Chemotaxis protein MotB n=1 Tax=Marinisporobacter balticus TaxID=2018667 RepID=A0A4R2LDQ6_9FIRM|nr:flagellar motor protein MotB [Marinisporobacter balticus]TCO77485.1 chemotaxis protein MotB [Marinisporobacter balticus]
MKYDEEKQDMDLSTNWLITYSDMITIVLCFFIIFFTMTSKEMSVLSEIKDVLSTEVSTLTSENEKLKGEKASLAAKLFDLKNIETDVNTSEEDFITFLRENNLFSQVKIVQNEKGLLIRFKDSVLFNSGKADLSEAGYNVLNQIGDKLKTIDNDIVVEGFTDNVPIHTKEFPSNWELSVSRAIQVVKFFTEDKAVDEKRISVSGFGERNSIDSNDTSEGRANNRRIEITILN